MAESTNVDRLLQHLEPDSLAERLVRAKVKSEQDDKTEAALAVLKERLKNVRENLDRSED